MGNVDSLCGIEDLRLRVEVLVAQHRLYAVQTAVGRVANPLVGVCKAKAKRFDERVKVLCRVVLHRRDDIATDLALPAERVKRTKTNEGD